MLIARDEIFKSEKLRPCWRGPRQVVEAVPDFVYTVETLCDESYSDFHAHRPAMTRELRRLGAVLDNMGLHIKSEWMPSVANCFADALSRRFPRGDLQIRRTVRLSVLDGMRAPIDAFPFQPVWEHPVFL